MGAWGTKSFEDDSTCDWYDEFCDSDQSIDQLEDAFDDVIENEEYLDYEFCTAALGAAEIIAAALGNRSDDFPDAEYHTGENDSDSLPEPDLDSIRDDITSGILDKARRAVKKVRQYRRSELRELWEDSDEYDDWLEATQDLMDRLEKS